MVLRIAWLDAQESVPAMGCLLARLHAQPPESLVFPIRGDAAVAGRRVAGVGESDIAVRG